MNLFESREHANIQHPTSNIHGHAHEHNRNNTANNQHLPTTIRTQMKVSTKLGVHQRPYDIHIHVNGRGISYLSISSESSLSKSESC